MAQDIAQITERYLENDPSRWARLSSRIHFRRLQVLLLRAILLELRKLDGHTEPESVGGPAP